MPKYRVPTEEEKSLIRNNTERPGIDSESVAVFRRTEDRLWILAYKEKGIDREFCIRI